jgi:hypothetical protein
MILNYFVNFLFLLVIPLILILYPISNLPLKLTIFVESINRDLYLYFFLYCCKMILLAVLKISNFDHFMNFFRIRSVLINNKLSLFHDNLLIVILKLYK